MDKGILKGLFSFFEKIRLIDIINDTVVDINYYNGTVIGDRTYLYSAFIDQYTSSMNSSDVGKVMDALSIQNLESAPGGLEVVYDKVDGTKYDDIFVLIDADKKLILNLSRSVLNSTDSGIKISTITDLVSDAILKIYNMFEANTSNNLRIEDAENYINSVFANLTSNYKDLNSALTKKAINVSSQFGKTLMIVDDDKITRGMLKNIFKDDYNIIEATNGNEAVEYLKNNLNKDKYDKTDNIVGMFLDLTMPIADGFTVLDFMVDYNLISSIPVLIISGDYSKETRNKVYTYSIADMIEKPFDFQVVKHRIDRLVNLYRSSNAINSMVDKQSGNANNVMDNILKAYNYDYENNIGKLRKYLEIIAKEGAKSLNLDDTSIEKMIAAVKYYDLGVYAIPKRIFMKKSLSDDDKKMIINRVDAGVDILDFVLKDSNDTLYKNYCYEILKYCHEYYSGKGYPYGIKGDEIPISAQLSAIVIDYMNLSLRYKHEECCNIILGNNNGKYSDNILDLFKKVALLFKNN